MARDLVAVVDQGSTATKAALVDRGGQVIAQAERKTPPSISSDVPGRIAIDADAIANDVTDLLDALFEEATPTAIGLTCQRSTCLLWNRSDAKPLTQALSWQDTSQAVRVEGWARESEAVRQRTGLRLSPYYAAAKLSALLEDLAGRDAESVARYLSGEIVTGTLDAFLIHRLTGAPATDPSHAGRTLLYNLEEGTWDPELLALFGLSAEGLPTLFPSAAPRGTYRGIPVTAGVGDQQAALLGHGGWQEGTVAVHFGTGAFVLASTGATVRRHEGLLSAVVAATERERRFQIEGSINSAGSAVDWAQSLTQVDLDDWRERSLDPDALPWVVPAFAGLGAPWWRPEQRASVHRLSRASTAEDLLAGTLVGLVMRVVDNLVAIEQSGARAKTLRSSGKLTRLHGFMQLLADLGQVTVEVSAAEETGLLGTARLARAGLSSAAPEGAPPAIAASFEPQRSARDVAALRQAWLEIIAP